MRMEWGRPTCLPCANTADMPLRGCYEQQWGQRFLPYWRVMVGYYDVKQGGEKSLKQRLKGKKKREL